MDMCARFQNDMGTQLEAAVKIDSLQVFDESPTRGPKLAFIEAGWGFLFAENHGWQWAKSFCFIAFDPGGLLFLSKWLLPNCHTIYKLQVISVVFDPGGNISHNNELTMYWSFSF